MSFITFEWARKISTTHNRAPSAATKCNETTRTTLLRFALSHRPNLNYLQFYGRQNVIIIRAKDHIAVGSRGWRSYLPPDLHPPAGRPFLILTLSLRRAFHSPLSLSLSPPLSLSHSLTYSLTLTLSLSLSLLPFLNDSPQNQCGGILTVSISSEAPLSSTDHLTHKWGIISSCNRVWTKKHYN